MCFLLTLKFGLSRKLSVPPSAVGHVCRNVLERTVFDRFVYILGCDDLAKLMRFITGNPQCGLQSQCWRPTSSTCGMVLHLPVSSLHLVMSSQ